MSTISTTISYMESMPENDKKKVMNFAAYVAKKRHLRNPEELLSEEQLVNQLEKSDKQYHEGKYLDAKEAITKARKEHGFI